MGVQLTLLTEGYSVGDRFSRRQSDHADGCTGLHVTSSKAHRLDQTEIVDEYKYLGVTLRCNGGFEVCQKILCQQGRRTMYSLIAKCRKFNLPVDFHLELFDAMVLPVLTYGCEIWGYKVHKAIEVVH